LETQGLIGLCFYDTGPRSFYTSKKPIRNVADLKDMSVRVQSSDILSPLLQSVGARPKPIPFGRVYDSLRSGAVDAAEFDFQTYEHARHHEVAKFYSVTEHTMAPSVLVFSKKIWDRLPAEDRLIIAAAARESVPYFRSLRDEYEPMVRKAVEAAGAEIITDVDRASFSDALVPAYARFVRDPKLRDMIKRIQATDSLRIMR
ncbi:MAG: TRAP transporter substrate-binding protein DctP, partial [Reyranella sp.]|nr:TRAP transporter substrate-binding protein DctP [Reyranella sp.]